MGFVRRRKTSSKATIPDGARKELEYLLHHEIVMMIEKHKIPYSMVIINIDQTPLKYVSVGNFTLAQKDSSSFTIEGVNDKRYITGTSGSVSRAIFFPIQLIYAGKTAQSLPRFKFPSEFSLSVNATHYSNSDESIKFIEEIIAPCMKKERERQHLSPTEKGLIIINVFKGQMTSDVSESLTKNYFYVVNIPANKTRFYQPLDITVNGFCKKFLKKTFTYWYAGQQPKQLAKGIKLDETNVKLLLSTLKPLHAGWMVDFYMEMTTLNGMEIIEIGWKTSRIQDTIKLGSKGLPPIDPFEDIDPLINENQAANEASSNLCIDIRGTFAW